MSPRAALIGALLATLAAPTTWPPALATFLLRGGMVLVVLPIVVLPSPVGLGNLLAPTLIALILGGVSAEFAATVILGALAIVTWIVLGGWIAATLEADSVRMVAGVHDGLGSPGMVDDTSDPGRIVAARILAARIIAHAPTAIVLILASIRLVDVAYLELTSPDVVTVPIVLRVLMGAPEVAGGLILVWALGEIVGGLATRRIVLDGVPVAGALRDAVRAGVRHPIGVGAGFVVPLAGLVLVILPSTVAANVAWSAVRAAMRSPADILLGTLAVLVFVSLWIVGLGLIGVTSAWRAAVWSVAYGRLVSPGAHPPGSTDD